MKPASSAAPEGGLEAPDRLGLGRPDGDDRGVGADRPGGDRHAFDHGVWIELEQDRVGPGRGIGAIAVGHDVAPVGRRRRRELPLVGGQEAGAAPAAQAGRPDLGDHAGRGEPRPRSGGPRRRRP